MLRAFARNLLVGAVLLALVGCGYDTSATFNDDGTVSVALKFLFPKSLMTGTAAGSVKGMSPSEIAAANSQLSSKYPGAKITAVTEGDEIGAKLTIPFKNEKDAFAFLTQPSTLNPGAAATGSGAGINLSNTGGIFASATHTTSGQSDVYTFKTVPPPASSPSPTSSDIQLTDDELASIFSVTFSLTVPHEIASAPGALFTLDRKTAIWKVSILHEQTLTATTGTAAGLTGSLTGNTAASPSPALLIGVGLVAIALGFVLGMFAPWRRMRTAPVPPPFQAPFAQPPMAWPGPPPGTPPPATPPHS